MSVKIQILDYFNETGTIGGQRIPNSTFNTTSDWDLGTGWSINTGNGTATHAGGVAGYLKNLNASFVEGQSYRIKSKVSGRTAGSFILANHLENGDNGFNIQADGAFEYDWVQGSQNTDKLSLFGNDLFDGTIEYAEVYALSDINWDKSIVGVLDVTDHSEFPLALTFQISDIKDITSTSGDFSKTFKVPATKNNNNLLKHLYIPNSISTNNVTENKPCEILVNDLYSIVGFLKITGVGGNGDNPTFYNCVFYGNNLGWAVGLDNLLMKDIDWNGYGTNLVYKKPEIMATWQDLDCTSSDSPLVYPIVSYGDFNFSESNQKIQLLDNAAVQSPSYPLRTGYYGFTDNSGSYSTPLPASDWRPAVFVKTTIEQIFKKIGYTVVSEFMETAMFKKLVWLLPNFSYNNPDDRYKLNAVDANFVNEATLTSAATGFDPAIVDTGVTQLFRSNLSETNGFNPPKNEYYYNGTGRTLVNLSNSGSNENLQVNLGLTNSLLNLTTNEITIGEYGYYNLRLKGLQVKVTRIFKANSGFKVIFSLGTTINLEVQTVGQTSWNIIAQLEKELNPLNATGGNNVSAQTTSQTGYIDLDELNIQGQYLNQGDKIRLTKGFKIDAETASQEFSVDVFWKSVEGSQFDVAFAPKYVEYGQTYNLNDVTNEEYKQLDFIKGVAHAFNLKMTTEERNKIINIEPFDSFYKTKAEAIDWTYKLDRSKETKDSWMKTDLKNNFVFKYKTDDKDATVQFRSFEYFKGIEDEYPYQEDLGSNFQRGNSIFENPFFSGTYNAKDQDTTGGSPLDNPFSACLWQDKEDKTLTSPNDFARPPKGYEFSPRLLFWNKYSPSGITQSIVRKSAKVQTWFNTDEYIVANANATGTIILSSIYPQATSINRDDSNSPILSYGNVSVRDYNNVDFTYTPYVYGSGLYDKYYRKMFNQLKQNPRIRNVYITLNITDIVNLDFRKLIYLDGVYWKINKINDFMPNKNKTTKVELIEWIDVGVLDPTEPTFGSSGGSTGGGLGWGQSPQDGGITDNQNIGV